MKQSLCALNLGRCQNATLPASHYKQPVFHLECSCLLLNLVRFLLSNFISSLILYASIIPHLLWHVLQEIWPALNSCSHALSSGFILMFSKCFCLACPIRQSLWRDRAISFQWAQHITTLTGEDVPSKHGRLLTEMLRAADFDSGLLSHFSPKPLHGVWRCIGGL